MTNTKVTPTHAEYKAGSILADWFLRVLTSVKKDESFIAPPCHEIAKVIAESRAKEVEELKEQHEAMAACLNMIPHANCLDWIDIYNAMVECALLDSEDMLHKYILEAAKRYEATHE